MAIAIVALLKDEIKGYVVDYVGRLNGLTREERETLANNAIVIAGRLKAKKKELRKLNEVLSKVSISKKKKRKSRRRKRKD